jgi:hypothetical protein
VVHILRYGIDAMDVHSKLDFGPGFYVNPYFKDAKDWCERHIAPYTNQQAAIHIFQVPDDVYNAWNIDEFD